MKITYILGVLLVLGGLFAIIDVHFIFGIAFVLICMAGLFLERKKDSHSDYTLELSLPKSKEENAAFLNELFTKAVNDYNFIEQAMVKISDAQLHAQLQKMQQIARNFIYYLQKQPQKILLARRFIDYYQDRAVFLVKKYIALEETQLAAQEISDIKSRMKEALNQFDEAYTEQFTKVMSEQIMDIDSELNVMQQVFDSEGIKKDEHIAPAAETKNEKLEKLISHFLSFDQDISRPRCYRQKWPDNCRGKSHKIWKKKLIAGGLAIFLGGLGAHKFYLCQNFWGILYILFCWTGLPSLVGFIEGIRYIFMPSDDFDKQYLNGK